MTTTDRDYTIVEGTGKFNMYPVIDGKVRKGILIGSFPFETSQWATISRDTAAHNAFLFLEALVANANAPA